MATSNTQKIGATADDSSLSASNGRKYSPASTSGGHNQWTNLVFLSFRGEDTRNNFTDHLYAALNQKGIYTFRDVEGLEKGKEISSELLEAIEISMVSIIILSKNYAFSKWCLNELAKIVDCMKEKDQTVLPVFYKVDPSNVRKQGGDFKTAFDKHEQAFRDNLEQVKRWRSALTMVGNLDGWHLQDGSEASSIAEIVDKVWKKVNQIQHLASVGKGFVGIDSRVKEIYELVGPDIVDETRFVGICGMGGIGKTTIAEVVYERLSCDYYYDGSCFLENVREESKKTGGLKSLQEKLLCGILKKKDINISNPHIGKHLIKWWLHRKKILLVLDDVDHQLRQLDMLAGGKDWFGFGSRIIITTRDEHVLISHGINNIYRVKELNGGEAYRLFCSKAFKHMEPTNDYVELSMHFVSYANGLPLALIVLGSFLCGRNVDIWKSALKSRMVDLDENKMILNALQISYDGLGEKAKKIFLDIAYFFKGGDVHQIKEIFDRCDFLPGIGIPVLVDRFLITIEDNKLQMHDMVQEMGQEVVREQDPTNPGKWSRLWLCQDIHRVLATAKMGTSAIEAMIIVDHKKKITDASGNCLLAMSNLRLLDISTVHISEDLEYLSNKLRILKWRGYGSKTLPSSFNPSEFFQLSLCDSRIEYLWDDIKSFEKLTIIELSNSQNLIKTPNFIMIPNLERLDLQHCKRLREVHQSVGSLKRLVVLNLNNCENLVEFPSDVCDLKSLQILNLHGCSKLDKLPLNLGEIKHLEELDVAGTAIRQVPTSIVQLTNLRKLSFCGCKGGPSKTWSWSSFMLSLLPTRKPDCMGLLLPPLAGMSSLQTLDLSDCSLSEGAVPRDVGSLHCLRELNIGGNNFDSLPDTMSQLSELKILWLERCHGLQSLPKLPPGLIFVVANRCTSLTTISSVRELTSADIGLDFFNCFNLVQTQDRSNSLAIMLLKRWLQRNVRSNCDPLSRKIYYNGCGSQFHIRLPGSEIPKFFKFQNEGSGVTARLLDGWLNDEFIGFAVCTVVSLPDHSDGVRIECEILTSACLYGVVFSYPGFSTITSDHLWLAYLSREELPFLHSGEAVSAHFGCSGQTKALVKRCGCHPLYKQNVEYLEDLSATDVRVPVGRDFPITGTAMRWIVMPGVLRFCRMRDKYYKGDYFRSDDDDDDMYYEDDDDDDDDDDIENSLMEEVKIRTPIQDQEQQQE